ncbi:MFS transporter [Streptomyces sp. NBRC 109706]|uniref:MFS transporter n=1 Tax=Streptomyces sp. NBRC 109706 TaxID=1550035 RepID=UPI000780C8F4|nr:MFS transporter [Streptomyces sp. NBRC 109706]
MAPLLRSPLGLCLLFVSAMTGVISVGYPLALDSAGFAKADIALFFVVNSLIAFTLALSSSRPAALRHAPRLLTPALLVGAAGVALVTTGNALPLVCLGGALSMAGAVSLPLILRRLQSTPQAAGLSDAVLATRTRWIAVAGYVAGVAVFAGSSSLTEWWSDWPPVGAAALLLAAAAVLATLDRRALPMPAPPPAPVGAGRLGLGPALVIGVLAIVLLKAADSLRLVYLPLFVVNSGWDPRLNSALFMATALVELAVLPWLGRAGERHPATRLLALAAVGGALSFTLTAAWASVGSLLASQMIYAVFAAALQSLGMVVLAGLVRGGLPAGAGLFAGVMQLGSLVGILAPLTISGYRPVLFWIAVAFCTASALVLLLLNRLTSTARPAVPPHPRGTHDDAVDQAAR